MTPSKVFYGGPGISMTERQAAIYQAAMGFIRAADAVAEKHGWDTALNGLISAYLQIVDMRNEHETAIAVLTDITELLRHPEMISVQAKEHA